jgi:hypothetical protein
VVKYSFSTDDNIVIPGSIPAGGKFLLPGYFPDGEKRSSEAAMGGGGGLAHSARSYA